MQALATYYLGLASGITCGLATGDFNGDGKLDIIAASASLEILLGNVDGTFQPPQIIGGGYSVAVGDYNGGGKLDVAAAGSLIAGSSQLAILLGNGNGTFQPPKTYAPPPNTYSSSVATADFNGDGKLDLAVGYYSVPPSHTLEGSLSVMLGNGDGTFQNPSTYTASGPVTGVLPMDLNGDGLLDLALTNGQDSNLLSVL